MIELGKVNNLTVVRKSDLGYMLSDGETEVLLHYRESQKELDINASVSVYIYTDKENRKTATMNNPLLTMDTPNFVEVVNVIPEIGVFVNNNTPKDLLVSCDYLPYNSKQWPIIGDKLFCGLKIKKNYLVAKPLNRFDIISCHSKMVYANYESVAGYVIRIAEKGIGIVTEDKIYVFVPNSQLRGNYRLGQAVKVTITKMLDGEAYGTLNEHKEILMDDDKELILAYLRDNNGVMNLTAKSSSEEVEKLFKMSRKAFKRAYGALYKEQLIDFDENKTFLTKKL